MRLRNLYLLPLLVLLAACSGNGGEKKLYPSKLTIGGTTHEFLYDQGRVYSVTTTRPDFYEEVTYRYADEIFEDLKPSDKNKIMSISYNPDHGNTGWDESDSVKYRTDLLSNRSDAGLVIEESQGIYLQHRTEGHTVHHNYNEAHQLSESNFYFYDTYLWSEMQLNDPRYMSKRVKYEYAQGKLAKVAYYGHMSKRPYLQLELTYDDKQGYLRNLPLEARFMPLELPYRDHNIVSYTVKDIYGKVRKDLSYTCTYSYNKAGYPVKFTRRMGDGVELEGYITYRAAANDLTEMLSVR